MRISNVCMFGGSGFIGQSVAEQLCAAGIGVRIVTRSEVGALPLRVLPTAEIVVADPHDRAQLARCVEGMDAVINLVGILHETRRQSFEACHVELPARIAEASGAAGVRHLLHMSALRADPGGPSEYLRSKGRGEAAVRAVRMPAITVLRPSVVFGQGDHFLNTFAALLRWLPVIALGGATARFQPIWVEDVARCFAVALGNTACFGQAYDLCGPRAYTLEELVQFVAATLGLRRRVVALPDGLARLQAAVLERLPGKLMTRDNLRSMSVDNVCDAPFPEIFGFEPAQLEVVAPAYLAATTGRARYERYRTSAGR